MRMRSAPNLSDQQPCMPDEGPSVPPPRPDDDEFGTADFEGPGTIARRFTLTWGGGDSPRLEPAREIESHDSAGDSDGFRMVSVRRERPHEDLEETMENTLGEFSELGSDEDLGLTDGL